MSLRNQTEESQWMHILGMHYVDGKEKEILHRRMHTTPTVALRTAERILITSRLIGSVTVLTEEEYAAYCKEKDTTG